MLRRSAVLPVLSAWAMSSVVGAQPPPPPDEQGSTTVQGVTVTARRPQDGPPRLELYEGRDFEGGGVIIVEATSNLLTRGFSDQARSARAIRGAWQLCNGPDYTPPCIVLSSDQPFLGDDQLSERVSSVRPLGAPPLRR